MNRILQAIMTLVMAICLAAPVLSAAADNNEQDAEVQFGIQLTAALNNDREAQFTVAQMYEQGTGTPQNLRMAHLWYTKSAKQGYAPAVEKLNNWEKSRQESENLVRERAEEQKRRQAETGAAAEEQKRRQAEAAASAAKAREEAAAKAARERAAAEEQKRRQAEAAASAAKAAHSEETAKAAKPSEPAAVVKEVQPVQAKDKPKETSAKNTGKNPEEFRANPCNTPTAKFTSTCQ